MNRICCSKIGRLDYISTIRELYDYEIQGSILVDVRSSRAMLWYEIRIHLNILEVRIDADGIQMENYWIQDPRVGEDLACLQDY